MYFVKISSQTIQIHKTPWFGWLIIFCKHITLEIEAASKDAATTKVDEACKKLLANQIMEFYEFELFEN